MSEPTPSQNINITFATLLRIVLVVFAVYILYQILDSLALVFVAIILATALDPWVDWMQRFRIPRTFGALLIYLVMFCVISLIVVLMLPPLVDQLSRLASNLPYYYSRLVSSISTGGVLNDEVSGALQQLLQSAGASLASATSSILSTLVSVFGGIVQFVITIVMTFYLLVQENSLRRFVKSITPSRHQAKAIVAVDKIREKLGFWLRGQLLLMLIIGVLDYIGLVALGIDYALVLALWAGLTEVIPYIGPVLGAIPGVALALSLSPWRALAVFALYIIVQQLENNIIVPVVMKKSVGLNPVVSIMVVLIGARLGGVVGALMSIPVATAAAVLLTEFWGDRLAGGTETVASPE